MKMYNLIGITADGTFELLSLKVAFKEGSIWQDQFTYDEALKHKNSLEAMISEYGKVEIFEV